MNLWAGRRDEHVDRERHTDPKGPPHMSNRSVLALTALAALGNGKPAPCQLVSFVEAPENLVSTFTRFI